MFHVLNCLAVLIPVAEYPSWKTAFICYGIVLIAIIYLFNWISSLKSSHEEPADKKKSTRKKAGTKAIPKITAVKSRDMDDIWK